MLRYYMDHHVPAAITNGLRRRSVDCITAADDQSNRWDDARLLNRATELGRVLVSQDVDLLAIAASWQDEGRPFAGLVYGKQTQVTIGQAVRDLELIANAVSEDEMRNTVVHIPL